MWQEDDYAIAALHTLRDWQVSTPTVDEFVRFVESNTCSDYNYESFYYALPYVLDELQSRQSADQFRMVSMLSWKLLKIGEGNLPDRCYEQLSACEVRIIELLTAINKEPNCPPDVVKYNRGAIAAVEGDPELGERIVSDGE